MLQTYKSLASISHGNTEKKNKNEISTSHLLNLALDRVHDQILPGKWLKGQQGVAS